MKVDSKDITTTYKYYVCEHCGSRKFNEALECERHEKEQCWQSQEAQAKARGLVGKCYVSDVIHRLDDIRQHIPEDEILYLCGVHAYKVLCTENADGLIGYRVLRTSLFVSDPRNDRSSGGLGIPTVSFEEGCRFTYDPETMERVESLWGSEYVEEISDRAYEGMQKLIKAIISSDAKKRRRGTACEETVALARKLNELVRGLAGEPPEA